MEQPTGKHARVEVADVLRGLAVMGIILLHSIEHFNFYSFPDTTGQSAWLTFTDKAVWDGLFFLLGGKAYAVFALLFGFSYFIQYDNQRMRGHDFRLRFCWRLILLFLIGNLNAMFFTAEVLVLYSLVGFILPLDLWGATFEVQSHGTFWETVRVNLWEGQLASLAWAWDNGRVFQTAALFLLGFLAGKRGLFLKENLKIWNKVLCGSLLAFFPLYGLGNMLPGFIDNPSIRTPLLLIISSLYKFAFMLLLVSAILFAYYRTRLQRRLAQIVPYGRMSLTNYITQSIFGSLLFYNWGFGLHDDLGITASFLTGILLFILQFSFCRWWMAHHSHGPMEYLWKRATWLK